MRPSVIGVTGASGYLGGRIADRLEADGHEVVEIGRRPSTRPRPRRFRPMILGERPGPEVTAGLDGLVHAAWDLGARPGPAWTTNVQGSRWLLDRWALDTGQPGRAVFISSMSAYPGTRQPYGLMKLAAEQVAFTRGAGAVRPGLVYGPASGGMVGALRRAAGLPVTPVIAPEARQFTAHEDDVTAGVARLFEVDAVPLVPLGFAHPTPVRFVDVIRALAEEQGGRLRSVTVPWRAVYLSMRLAEAVGLPLPLRSDSVLGLVRSAPAVANVDVVRALGISFRALGAGP